MKNFLFVIFLLFFSALSQASSFRLFAAQKAETRAVWVATNYRLDWPAALNNSALQKQELENIFNDIKAKGFNTIYFQVRSSGKVLFKSKHESTPSYFYSADNETENYDPAQFAVELAHNLGLKIHAWVNMVRCFAGNAGTLYPDDDHVINKQPGWIVEYLENGKRTYWLDPGLPETRNYLLKLITEITAGYNFDGIQYDYIRYPGKNFDDEFSYSAYGNAQNIDDWRRDNINKLLIDAKNIIRSIKPNMLIGAAPIGVYQNASGYYALQGYSDVYQDSYFWLENDLIDYLVPQIYWGLTGKPNFIDLSKTWLQNSFGKNIILGIGAFKPEVFSNLNKVIEHVQKSSAAGYAIFRYGDIKNSFLPVQNYLEDK